MGGIWRLGAKANQFVILRKCTSRGHEFQNTFQYIQNKTTSSRRHRQSCREDGVPSVGAEPVENPRPRVADLRYDASRRAPT